MCRAAQREAERDVTHAWLVAKLQRAEKIPNNPKKLMKPRPVNRSGRKKSWQEMRQAAERYCRTFGVVEKPGTAAIVKQPIHPEAKG
ncbi:hypothetical protein NX02_29340 [Sphingomonas sanxanigenens DSM 19645 = NX02]|uniref:Uncharacterized protein n=1 Tax=Sphingomonas sanxanigenens DSM 19645 = NX02 TaxID=1123269 RepID=W0ALG6_9SPHN|nr:hypothetical protein NX02_29340 [Sphingomonas sanxanigenens DSM 19645 = NX02]